MCKIINRHSLLALYIKLQKLDRCEKNELVSADGKSNGEHFIFAADIFNTVNSLNCRPTDR